MKNIYCERSRLLGIVAALVLPGCASLFTNMPAPKLGMFTQDV
jgi:hypothetical protein